jgi:hypothetical protein
MCVVTVVYVWWAVAYCTLVEEGLIFVFGGVTRNAQRTTRNMFLIVTATQRSQPAPVSPEVALIFQFASINKTKVNWDNANDS